MRHLAWALCILALPACTTSRLAKWRGKTLYNKVSIRAESVRGGFRSYSTNYYGVPVHLPVNTKFRLSDINGKQAILESPKLDKPLYLVYIPKHNQMPFEDYLSMVFSERPQSIPGELSAREKKLVKKGQFKSGMSREAFFMAMGYPPASLNDSLNADQIVYEKKRFNKTTFVFRNDRLIRVKE